MEPEQEARREGEEIVFEDIEVMGLPLGQININSDEANWEAEINDPQVFENILEGEESVDILANTALLDQG